MPQIPVWYLPEVAADGCVALAEDNERGRATKPEDEADGYSMVQGERPHRGRITVEADFQRYRTRKSTPTPVFLCPLFPCLG